MSGISLPLHKERAHDDLGQTVKTFPAKVGLQQPYNDQIMPPFGHKPT